MHRLVAAFMVLSFGCGLTQVNGPASNRPPNVRPECTTSDKLIRVDAGLGAVGILTTLLGIALSQAETADPTIPAVMVIGGLGLTIAMLASSGVGYSKVKKCRKAVEEFDRASMSAPPPGYPYPPPAQPYPPPSVPLSGT